MFNSFPKSLLATIFLLVLSGSFLFANIFSSSAHRPGAAKRYLKSHKAAAYIVNRHFRTGPGDSIITTSTGSNSFCAGGSIILTASPAPAGATYQWLQGVGVHQTAIPGATGSTYGTFIADTYTVIVTLSGHSVTYPAITLTTNPNPIVTFTFNNNNSCSGTNILFTPTVKGGKAPFNYSWDFGDGGTVTTSNPAQTHMFNALGCSTATFAVNLIVTDANGCSAAAPSQQVDVIMAPDVQLQDTDQFYSFSNCHNNPSITNASYTIKVNNVSPSVACIKSYTLDWGDKTTVLTGLTAASFPLTHTYPKLGAFPLTVTALGTNNCTNTVTYQVANQANPAGGLGTLGSTTGLCAPAVVPFIINNWQLNSPGTTYVLDFGDGTSVTLNHPLLTDTIYHTYKKSSCPNPSFTALLNVVNACTTTPYTAGDIQVQIKPSSDFTYSNPKACVGQPVTFINSTLTGFYGGNCSSATVYNWRFGDPGSSSNTSNLENPSHTYNHPGTYADTLISSNPCGYDTVIHSIVVSPIPKMTSPNAATICSGQTVTIPLTSDIPSNYIWVAGYNPNVTGEDLANQRGSPLSNTLINNSSTVQTVVYTVTPVAIGSGCPGTPQTVNVTVNPQPAAPVANTTITYCLNDVPAPLAATVSTRDTLKWYTSAALTNGTKIAPVPGTSKADTTYFYVTQVNSTGCESTPTIITVTVNPPINNNKIGNNQTICSATAPSTLIPVTTISGGNNSYNYQWLIFNSNTKNWDAIPGQLSDSFSPPPLTATTKYRRVVFSGACQDTSNTVIITVQGALSNYDITGSQTICGGITPSFLTGQIPAGGNGTFKFQWQTSVDNSSWSDITDSTNINYQPPPLTVTTYYRRMVTSSTCTAFSSPVTITVNPSPVMNAIPDQFFCNGATVTAISFISTPANNTTFAWTSNNTAIGLTSGSGSGSIASFIATNNTKAPITAKITVTATYSFGGSSCSAAPLTFTITVLPTIGITQRADTTVCSGNQVPAFVPANDAKAFPGGSVGYVYTVSGDNIGLSGSNGSQVPRVPAFTPANTSSADLTAKITVTPVYNYAGQACEGMPMSYTITVNAMPTAANAGSNDKTCNTSYQLNGNTPVAGIGTWTELVGPMVPFNDKNDAQTTINNLQKGTEYQFTWTIANKTCAASASNVTIDVLSDIVNTIKSDVPSTCPCQAVHLSTTALSGGDVPGKLIPVYTYAWEASPNGINGWQPVNNGSSANLTVSPCDTTWYRRTVSSYGLCPVISNVIEITTNPVPPIAVAGNSISLCSQTTAQLNGNNPGIGFKGTWTASDKSLTFSPDSNTYNAIVNNLVPGNPYKLTWTIASPSCGSTSSTLTINNLQTITNKISPPVTTICSGQSVTITGSVPTGAGGNYVYSWESSPDGVNNWQGVPNQAGQSITFLPAATIYIRRNVTSGSCSLESDSVIVMVLPPLDHNNISADQQICTGAPIQLLTGSVPTGGDGNYIYRWQDSTATGRWKDISPKDTLINYQPAVLTQTTYYRRIVSSASCLGSQKSISNVARIGVNADAKAEFRASTQTGCIPFNLKNVITLVPHADVDTTYEWFANGDSIGTGPAFPAYSILTDGTSVTIKLVTISKFGCDSDSFSMVFTTPKTVTASFTKTQVSGCGQQTISFTNTSTPIDSAHYTWNFGNRHTFTGTQPGSVPFTPAVLNHDTTYYITLNAITNCGTTTYRDSVTIIPPLKATFTPDKTSGCSPLTVNITNQSSGIANQYIYDFGDGKSDTLANNQAVQHTYVTAKVDTFTVKLTATNACGTDISSYQIVVAPNSVQPNLVVNGNNMAGCAPYTVTFSNNSTGANNFNYNFGDTSDSTTFHAPETVVHTFKKPGTYNVKLTASNNCSTASTSQTITVTAPPVVKFLPGKPQYCVNDTAVFINSSQSSSAINYVWNFGDASSSSQVNPTHVFKKAGNDTVTLTSVRDTLGIVCSVTVSHIVTVVPLPTATFASNYGSVNCAPFLLSVDSRPTNAVSVSWIFGDPSGSGNAVGGVTAQHLFTTAGAYVVEMIAYNNLGCSDTTKQTIQVNPAPIAKFSVANTVSCVPFKIDITNNSINTDNYTWKLNGNVVSTAQTPTNIVLTSAGETDTLKLIATNIYGCQASIATQLLVTSPKPIASFSLKDSISCSGELKIAVTNLSANATSYSWSFGDSSPNTNLPVPVHTYGPGIYKLQLIAINGLCRDTVSRMIQVTNPPKSAFTEDITAGCESITTTFQNLSVYAIGYQWDFGDSSFSTDMNPPPHNFNYTRSPYTVKLVAYGQYGCNDSTIMYKLITVAPPLKADFEAKPDSVLKIPDHTFTFTNLTIGDSVKYSWDFGDSTRSAEQNPVHTYSDTGIFKVQLSVANPGGCRSSRTRTVRITGVPEYLFVPNAFEPASLKSELQTFNVRSGGLKTYVLKIFNKWGQLVFQTTALDANGYPSQGWGGNVQGAPAPQGVYVWEIHATFVDGSEWHGMRYNDSSTPSTTGFIHLIR